MKVITFNTQKGGSGKSTIAASLAVAAVQSGRRVLVYEMDKQGSMTDWINDRQEWLTRRDKEGYGPDFKRVSTANLERELRDAEQEGYDLVLIDTPGVDSPDNNAIMRIADLVLIPCRPTTYDLRGCLTTVEILLRLKKPFAFVLSQCTNANSSRVEETRKGLLEIGMAAETAIISRTEHQDATAAGMGITEYRPKGEAAGEMWELLEWVDKKLGNKAKHYGKPA